MGQIHLPHFQYKIFKSISMLHVFYKHWSSMKYPAKEYSRISLYFNLEVIMKNQGQNIFRKRIWTMSLRWDSLLGSCPQARLCGYTPSARHPGPCSGPLSPAHTIWTFQFLFFPSMLLKPHDCSPWFCSVA